MARTTETTPLLATSAENSVTQTDSETLDINKIGVTESSNSVTLGTEDPEQQQRKDEDKPLPVGQIILLCYARLVEPVAFFSIFPYINQMIEEVGSIQEEDVGFYSGLIESLFSLTQMVFMISWGRAADRFGRKPILVYSVIGASIATCLFGFSRSIWQMIVFRCLAGVFSGTIVTVRTMLAENSTLKNQARAFSWFAFSGNLGIFIGPVIGGALSSPARQYPGAFGNVRFFIEYPYALPSIISSSIGFSAAAISAFFLKETLEQKKGGKASTEPPMSTWELTKQPGVPTTLFLWCFVSLQGLANTAVLPVFWFTSVSLGGLGFTPLQISLFLGLAGLSQAFWLLFVFPPAQRRFGTGGVLRFAAYLFPIGCALSPVGNALLRHRLAAVFWTLLPTNIVLSSGASMSFTCMQLAVNNISPSPAVLGTMNALALAMTAGIRAVTPGLFASLFATGVRNQILDGYFIWVIMVIMALVLLVSVHFLPEKAEGNIERNDENEEERS